MSATDRGRPRALQVYRREGSRSFSKVVQVAQEDCQDPGELHPEEPGLRKPGVSVIKNFLTIADDGTKKHECLSLAGL